MSSSSTGPSAGAPGGASSPTRGSSGMVNIELGSPTRSREGLLPSGAAANGKPKQVSPGSQATSESGNASPSPTRASKGSSRRRRHSSGSTPVGAAQRASAATVALLAAIMGNVLEFYDFSVYAFFAPEIGKLFFPPASPAARAVRTFTVFAGGFLMRPIGSVLLGAIGDKFGTAAALKWSILLMTVPTVVTGCLPTYKHVGMAAPFLLTACRLLQGLSVGGELIGALLHTSDHSPDNRRGFLCGLVAVFGSMGNLLGSIVSVGMRHALTDEQLMSWGWRVPFLTGSLLGVVGILLRTQTQGLHEEEDGDAATSDEQGPEERLPLQHNEESSAIEVLGEAVSPAVLEADRTRDYRARHPVQRSQSQPVRHATFMSVMRAAAGADKLRFLQVVVLAALNNAHFYLHFVWLGTYLAQLAPRPIPASQAFSVTCVAQVCFILTNPLWGAMGDRLGGPGKRLRWNLVGVGLGCVLPPLLFKLVQPGKMPLDFLYAAASGLLMGFVISGNYYAWVCEALHDAPARVMTTSVAYNLGAITGGAYPMLASALAEYKEPTAPVLPVAVAAVLGLASLVYMQRKLDGRDSSNSKANGPQGQGVEMVVGKGASSEGLVAAVPAPVVVVTTASV